jgi:hypothetical protein
MPALCPAAQCQPKEDPTAVAITVEDLQNLKMASYVETCSVLNICNEKRKQQP